MKILSGQVARAKRLYCLRVSAVKIFAYLLLILSFTVCIPVKVLPADDQDAVKTIIFDWRDAWKNKDIDQFMSFYGPDFRSNALDYSGLRQKKTRLFQSTGTLSVDISDLKIRIRGRRAAAAFIQRYQSPTHADVGVKTLVLAKTDQSWKIISEHWRPLKAGDHEIIAPAMPSAPAQPSVTRIDFKVEDNGTEKVTVAANHFAIPTVLTLEGTKPRIAIDFENIAQWEGKPLVQTNGRWIRKIRSYLHRDRKKLRIVLDLNPAIDYAVKPTYQEQTNTYYLQVKPLSGIREKQQRPSEAELTSRIISGEWEPLSGVDKTVEEPVVPPTSDALLVKSIDFKIEENGTEKIFITMNRFAVPEIMALEGRKPRIAVDINNILSWGGKPASRVNGQLIKQIRTHLHQDTKKLRIVIDLDAEKNYSVNPIYYESDHIYCVEIRPQ